MCVTALFEALLAALDALIVAERDVLLVAPGWDLACASWYEAVYEAETVVADCLARLDVCAPAERGDAAP